MTMPTAPIFNDREAETRVLWAGSYKRTNGPADSSNFVGPVGNWCNNYPARPGWFESIN